MCDIISFDCTVATATGWPILLWDFIFTLSLAIGLMVILEFSFNSGRSHRSGQDEGILFVSGGMGLIGGVMVGWVPYWAIIFLVLIIALALLAPWKRGHP